MAKRKWATDIDDWSDTAKEIGDSVGAFYATLLVFLINVFFLIEKFDSQMIFVIIVFCIFFSIYGFFIYKAKTDKNLIIAVVLHVVFIFLMLLTAISAIVLEIQENNFSNGFRTASFLALIAIVMSIIAIIRFRKRLKSHPNRT